MQERAVADVSAPAARNAERSLPPRPRRPMAPAWIAVRRDTVGCVQTGPAITRFALRVHQPQGNASMDVNILSGECPLCSGVVGRRFSVVGERSGLQADCE